MTSFSRFAGTLAVLFLFAMVGAKTVPHGSYCGSYAGIANGKVTVLSNSTLDGEIDVFGSKQPDVCLPPCHQCHLAPRTFRPEQLCDQAPQRIRFDFVRQVRPHGEHCVPYRQPGDHHLELMLSAVKYERWSAQLSNCVLDGSSRKFHSTRSD